MNLRSLFLIFIILDISLQIYGTGNPSYPCSSWTLDTNGHIQTSVLPPVKLQSSSTFPVATSMANSTTSAMKIMPPGPAGRSSPEGSQVSLLFTTEPKYAATWKAPQITAL